MKKSDKAKKITFAEYIKQTYGIQIDTSKREVLISAPYRKDAKPSLSINLQKQVFNDFATGAKGSIIDFVMTAKGLTFCQALDELTAGHFSLCSPISYVDEQKEPTTQILEVKDIYSYALKNYLIKRCIDPVVAKAYLKEIVYTCGDRKFYTLGMQNRSFGWVTRNQLENGKRNIGPSDITHIQTGDSSVRVFEGMFDAFSWLSRELWIDQNFDINGCDIIILNSVTNADKALPLLKDYEMCFSYMDNDEAGELAEEKLKKGWEEFANGTDMNFCSETIFIDPGKDFNDMWVSICKREGVSYIY